MNKAQRAYHACFSALAIFSAEAVCGNEPWGPLNPFLYLAYGLLYVLFLDFLVRRRVSSWATAYLLGVLVGYLTESFVAKVMWFGWHDNTVNPGGVLPWPELPFLAFFYHPVFSFLVPLYIAVHHGGYPVPLRRLPAVDRLLWLWPLFPALVASPRYPRAVWLLALTVDLVLIVGVVALLKKRGPIADVRLDAAERRSVLRALAVSYLVFFTFLPPYGREAMRHPSAFQVAFAVAFTAGVAWLVRRRAPAVEGDDAPVPFDPSALDRTAVARFAAYFVLVGAAGLAAAQAAPAAAHAAFVLFVLGGLATGTIGFLRVVARTLSGS